MYLWSVDWVVCGGGSWALICNWVMVIIDNFRHISDFTYIIYGFKELVYGHISVSS